MYLTPLDLPKPAVLVLEDDPFLRAGLCGLLKSAGYRLAEGLDAANPAGRPTASVDLVLAGMGTRQAPNTALQLLDRAAPLILLVDQRAWSGLDFLDIANAFAAAAVLPRPFPRAALLSLMAKVLSQPPCEDREAQEAELPNPTERMIFLNSPNLA